MKLKKMNQKGVAGALEVLLVVVLISLVGFTVWRVNTAKNSANTSNANSLEASQSSIAEQKLPENLDGLKTVEEIKTLAAQNNNGLEVLSVRLEQDNGKLVYKVKLSDGTVLVFSAGDGQLIKDDEKDSVADTEEALPAGFVAGVSVEQATQNAQEQHGGSVVKVELEMEHGTVVYKVRFADGVTVNVNATTGTVVKVDTSDADENDNEAETKNEDKNENEDKHKNDDSNHDLNDNQQDDSHQDGDNNDSGSN